MSLQVTLIMDGLRRAIDGGRLDIAVELVEQNEALGRAGVSYVIRENYSDPDFIASFVNQTNLANASTLYKLLSESSIKTFGKVLEKVDFPQQVLIDLAATYNVGIFPDKFLVLLNKIVKPEDQEKAVENATEQLIYKPTETSRLLNALKGKTFRSERLAQLAIQNAFMQSVKYGKVDRLPEDICGHAAITPELYTDALIVTVEWSKDSSMRPILLTKADRYDLKVVKEKAGYEGLNAEFRDDIEKALGEATPGGTRTRAYDIQTVEKARKSLRNLDPSGIPENVFSIVGESVMRNPPTDEKAKSLLRKPPKMLPVMSQAL